MAPDHAALPAAEDAAALAVQAAVADQAAVAVCLASSDREEPHAEDVAAQVAWAVVDYSAVSDRVVPAVVDVAARVARVVVVCSAGSSRVAVVVACPDVPAVAQALWHQSVLVVVAEAAVALAVVALQLSQRLCMLHQSAPVGVAESAVAWAVVALQ